MLKITVLVDNNALIGRYFLAEPGFSLWIECGGRKILFDAGYSGIFLRNARLMGIDAAAPDTVVLSHGHSDHTWGLSALISERTSRGLRGRPELVCHPGAFARKKLRGADAGMIIAPEVLGSFFDLRPSREVLEIAENLYWLGEIEPLVTPRGTLGEAMDEGGEWRPDACFDDSALVYDGADGLVIITGCSHSGICNIVEQAKRATGRERIADVIGGFHLRSGSEEEMRPVLSYFEKAAPHNVHACHCTCFAARAALAAKFETDELGVSSVFEFK